jgi:hypothetical protein
VICYEHKSQINGLRLEDLTAIEKNANIDFTAINDLADAKLTLTCSSTIQYMTFQALWVKERNINGKNQSLSVRDPLQRGKTWRLSSRIHRLIHHREGATKHLTQEQKKSSISPSRNQTTFV